MLNGHLYYDRTFYVLDLAMHVICSKDSVLLFSGFCSLSFQFPTAFISQIIFSSQANLNHLCARALFQTFISLQKIQGFQLKLKKPVYPTTTLTFWSLWFDTVCFQVRLPQGKLDQLKSEINQFQNKYSATLQELQSLINMSNIAGNVIPPGRTFLRRQINLTISKNPITIESLTWKQGQI